MGRNFNVNKSTMIFKINIVKIHRNFKNSSLSLTFLKIYLKDFKEHMGRERWEI